MTRRQPESRIIGIILALCSLFEAGCSKPLYLWDARTDSIPRSESVTLTMLTSDPLAVLAPITPPALKGIGPVMSHALTQALSQASKPMKIIPAYETLTRLNRKGLAPDYQRMVSGFDQASLFDRQLLDRVGSALGVHYVLQPGVAEFSQILLERLNLAGYTVIRTRTNTLRLWLDLWDTKTGEILWESAGEITLSSEVVTEQQVSLDDMAVKLWGLMVEDLLGNKRRSKVYFTEEVQVTKPEPAAQTPEPAPQPSGPVAQTPETKPESATQTPR